MNESFFLLLLRFILQARFKAIISYEQEISLVEINFDSLKENIFSLEEGFVVKNYGKTEVPKLISFFPITKIEAKTIRNIFGPIGILAFWEDSFDLEQLWNKMGNNLVNLFQCNEVHALTARNRKDMMYQIANFKILQISWDDKQFTFGINNHLYQAINVSIKQESEISIFMGLMNTELQKQTPIKKILPKLQIEKRKEFIVGNFLILPFFHWGKIPVKAHPRYIHETHSKEADEMAFWYGLSLTYDDKSYYLQYGFPHQKLEKPEEIQAKYQSLIVSIIKQTIETKWNQLSKPLQKYGSKFLQNPIVPMFEKGILVEYDIHINQSHITCHVIVPKALVDFLMLLDLETHTYESAEPILHFINLNRKFVSENFSDTFKVYFHQTESRRYPILLFEFLSIIDESNIRLTIQNYFVANGMKTIDLQRLFFYINSESDQNNKTLYLDEDFDENKIKSLLPIGMQKEWEEFPIHIENRTGLMSIAYNYDEFVTKNRETMQNIYEACKSGKIDFSPQTRYILFAEFEKLIREETQNKLNVLNVTSRDIFLKLKDVPKANIQQFFYSRKSEELGSIFFQWENELLKMEPYVSKKFYQEVAEDLATKKLQDKKSTIDLKGVLDLKEKFVSELRVLTSEEYV